MIVLMVLLNKATQDFHSKVRGHDLRKYPCQWGQGPFCTVEPTTIATLYQIGFDTVGKSGYLNMSNREGTSDDIQSRRETP